MRDVASEGISHVYKQTRHPEEGHARGWGVWRVPMPRRGGLPLFCFGAEWLYLVAGRDVVSEGISNAALTKVDRHRIAWCVVAYHRGRQMQFFAMTS